METLIPFLMFCGEQHGKAEEAMRYYCSIFEDSDVVMIDRYGPDDAGPQGTVRTAELRLGGHPIRVIDSAAPHGFTFTPAISLWIDCTSEEELRRVATALSDDGSFLMPVGAYGFSDLFCWIADRFGVTWQLNLPA